jgi:multiple sugar transport system permease protein
MTGAAPATAAVKAAGPGGKRHLSDRTRAERRLAFYLVAPAAIVMIAVTAYPIIDTIILSLQRASLDKPGQNAFIGFDNYGYVFKAHLFWMDLIHTVVITVISVSIELVLGMLLALAMHRVIFARGLLDRARPLRDRRRRRRLRMAVLMVTRRRRLDPAAVGPQR